jgi:hypothetical protein
MSTGLKIKSHKNAREVALLSGIPERVMDVNGSGGCDA